MIILSLIATTREPGERGGLLCAVAGCLSLVSFMNLRGIMRGRGNSGKACDVEEEATSLVES